MPSLSLSLSPFITALKFVCSSMCSPMLPASLYTSTLSDHSHYLCNCLSFCQEMTSAQASGLMSDPGYIILFMYVYLYLKQLK